jgi:excisionase family DNA binding protein
MGPESRSNSEEWLRPLIRAVVLAVLAEVGQGTVPRLYDPDQAAALLSVPKRWLYERTSAKTIPHQRLGKFIRFTDEDLRAIIEGRS